MSTAVLSTSDLEVSEALVDEIDSIKIATGSESTTVTYAPEAWTREGRVD